MRSTLLDRSRGRSTGTTGEVQAWIQVPGTMGYPYGLVLDAWQMSLSLNYARFGPRGLLMLSISDRRTRPNIWVPDGLSGSRVEVQSVSFQQSPGTHRRRTRNAFPRSGMSSGSRLIGMWKKQWMLGVTKRLQCDMTPLHASKDVLLLQG